MMDYKNLIMNSKSVRSFKDEAIDEKVFNEIKDFVLSSKVLVPGIEIGIKFFEKEEIFNKINGLAGYEGFLVDAPYYMVMVSEDKPHYTANAGYIGEKARLKATDLGVDSCWITFNDGDKILENIGADLGKKLVALIAFGHAKEAKKKMINPTKSGENYSKSEMAKAFDAPSERKAIEEIVYMDKWGQAVDLDALEERALLDAFSYVRLAPSALNRQPWRFIVDGGKVVLVVDEAELGSGYEGRIDSGIAMLYFGAVIDATLLDSKWDLDADLSKYEIPEGFRAVGYCNV